MILEKFIASKRFANLIQTDRRKALEQNVEDFLPSGSSISKLFYLVNLQPKVKHVLAVLGSLTLLLVFLPFTKWVIFVATTMVLFSLLLVFLARRSIDRFTAELPFFVMSLKSLLKAGVDCVQGIQLSLENYNENSLLRREFELFISNIKKFDFKTGIKNLGSNLTITIPLFGRSFTILKSPNSLGLLKNALWISSQEGASLTDFLDRIVSYCRISENFSQRVRSATIMQLISGYMIALLSFLPLGNKFLFNRSEFEALVGDPVGSKLLVAGFFLVFLGLLSLNLLCSKKI